MVIHFEELYSEASSRMKKSEIRELLKLTNKPGIISFAGGLPDPETFPKEVLPDVFNEVVEKYWRSAFQYGSTEGLNDLKDEIIKKEASEGIEGLSRENLLIPASSQQALDLIGKVFLNKDDVVITHLPTYLGAIQSFKVYGCIMDGVENEPDGPKIEAIEEMIKDYKAKGKNVKLFYMVPDFQNPGGLSISKEKRLQLIELTEKYNMIMIEDSPYRELRYTGEDIPTIFSMDKYKRTIKVNTFSKILMPGVRLAWIVSYPHLIDKIVLAKQASDLCTSPMSQMIVKVFMERGLLKERIEKNIAIYSKKREKMLEACEKYMPAGVHWTKPEGGMFLWMTFPEHISGEELFKKAIEKNVAFVVGSAFYPLTPKSNTGRINFSFATLEQIEEGIKRLSAAVKEFL